MTVYMRSLVALAAFGTIPPISSRRGLILWYNRCPTCSGRGIYSAPSRYIEMVNGIVHIREGTAKTTNCSRCDATGMLTAQFGEHQIDWTKDV